MLRTGSIILSLWSAINGLLASLILVSVVVFRANAPILVMVFEKPEIPGLDPRAIAAVNALAVLYNSCSLALSVLALFVIWSSLIKGQAWALWALLIAIGCVQALAFVAAAPINNARWPVTVLLTALYGAGIVLSGYGMLRR